MSHAAKGSHTRAVAMQMDGKIGGIVVVKLRQQLEAVFVRREIWVSWEQLYKRQIGFILIRQPCS
jgi:hypothetical protein